ncbi:hypothetical protein BC938DRAFT_472398 [Jimgerdemannia flammicorona]|uniref:Uncharacterized protein n=1 Tax=Jimgerdemannia flammicorona TaxID=994334 RepID=A0A433Q658_9FUNG|nr:hypothetical protein BC938DRAFT_472398 [Jimgerdemannia flammicorona]
MLLAGRLDGPISVVAVLEFCGEEEDNIRCVLGGGSVTAFVKLTCILMLVVHATMCLIGLIVVHATPWRVDDTPSTHAPPPLVLCSLAPLLSRVQFNRRGNFRVSWHPE